jgi:hypothetical protein
MIMGLQIMGILFALIMIYFTYLYYKRQHYNLRGLIVWMGIWCGFAVMIVFPESIYGIMQTLKIERTVDFFVIGGFFVFSIILFHLYIITKDMQKKMENLVRKIAIMNKKEKNEK